MDDALYLFAVLGLMPPHYDLVCCDEAQDFNLCQIRMVERFAKQGSRVIYVGDPNQSIYAFRGSCTTAFSQIKQVLPDCHEMNLKVNYRCDPRIIQFTNENSCVTSMIAGKDLNESREVIPECDQLYFLDNVQGGDAVLARTNDALGDYACYVYSRGLCPAFIKDSKRGSIFISKICDAIITFYRKKCEQNGRKFFIRNIDQQIIKLFTEEPNSAIAMTVKQVLRVDAEAIDNLVDFQACLSQRLEEIPLDKNVWFMTVHASKGLEYDNVWFVRYDDFLTRMAD